MEREPATGIQFSSVEFSAVELSRVESRPVVWLRVALFSIGRGETLRVLINELAALRSKGTEHRRRPSTQPLPTVNGVREIGFFFFSNLFGESVLETVATDDWK